MRDRTQRGLAVMLAGVVLMALACGGAATRARSTPGGPPPAVVQQLQAPDSPYRIIYYPPVSLAKQPPPPKPAPASAAARPGKPRH